MDELSAEELADRSGVTTERLGRLVELGIISPTPAGGTEGPTSSGSGWWTPWPMPGSRPSSWPS
jgi:hypothetical protein